MDKIRVSHYRLPKWLYILVWLALAAGMVLSIISALEICSEACSEGHKYRLYGIALEPIGVTFFALCIILWGFARHHNGMRVLVGAAIFAALGAEIMFTYAQKAIIGYWCPVCLSIGSVVALTSLLLAISLVLNLGHSILNNESRSIMNAVLKIIGALCMITMGFLFAHLGFAKFSHLQASEAKMRDSVAFGNPSSDVEVYIVTDWKCPACHRMQPMIEKAFPKISAKAKVLFIDLPIHEASLNFTPYHLAFMVNHKNQYLELRKGLQELALKTDSPTEEQIEGLTRKLGINFIPLNYADVSAGVQFFQHMAAKLEVNRTPTIVVLNTRSKKGKKLNGVEISETNILNSIDRFNQTKSK